ncbi:MFS transporter [Candidatus Campbellbacteria bacterium]|nr:MAG: MFS transporter [Candidatus Campbellbacteria bacterium]
MKRTILLKNTYLFTFFLGLHAFLFLYINSSILEQFVSQKQVGVLFAISSLFTIPILIFLPHILKKFGDVRLTLATLILEGTALFYLVSSTNIYVVIMAFFAHTVLLRILLLDTDVLLESASRDAATGKTRGIFLTILNSSLVLSPLLVGILLQQGNTYMRVFVAALCALVPAFLILAFSFKHFSDPRYTRIALVPTIKKMWNTQALRIIFMLDMVLRTFYATMVIYMGMYLHTTLSLPWSSIGIIFTVMLLPFALLEFPLGYLADTRFGEKEMLIAGLMITGITTVLLPWITSTSVIVWSIALLITRIGASTIEIMTETYFFKHVQGKDLEMMSLYRIVEPCAYVVAPIGASILLFFIDTQYLFLVLGAIVLCGLVPAYALHDTK